MSMVVPDTIEPIIGYKALGLDTAGVLWSPSYTFKWEPKERTEAICANVQTWGWVPIDGPPRPVEEITDLGLQQLQGRATTLVVATSAVTTHTHPRRPSKPTNPLPPGWNWSWEPHTHAAPDEACSCGIYIANTPDGVKGYLTDERVVAEVAIWGKTIRAHSGARGQYAYPQRLFAPDEENLAVLRDASGLYGIPYMVAPFVEQEPTQLDSPAIWTPYQSTKPRKRWRVLK